MSKAAKIKAARIGPGFVVGYAEGSTPVTLQELVPESVTWQPTTLAAVPQDREKDIAEVAYALGTLVRDLDNPMIFGPAYARDPDRLHAEMRRIGAALRRTLVSLVGHDRDVPERSGGSQITDAEPASPEFADDQAPDHASLKSAASPGVLTRLTALRAVREALDPRSEGGLGAADLLALAEWVVSSDAGPAFDLHNVEQAQITERERIRHGSQS